MFFLRVVRLLKPVHINDAHVTQMLYFCSNFGTTNPLEGLLNCPSEELVLSEMWPPTLKQCGLYHICINQELLHFRFLTYYFFFRMWRRNVSQGWLNCFKLFQIVSKLVIATFYISWNDTLHTLLIFKEILDFWPF